MSSALLTRLLDAGVQLKVDGEDLVIRPPEPLSDEQLAFLREHKPELLAELRAANEVPEDTSAIRARLLQDLEANPDLVRAVEVIDSDADPVRIIIALRGAGTCELQIAAERWDPFKFLELVEASGTTRQ